MNRIYYDRVTGNRLKMLELRDREMALYKDLEDGSHVLCLEQAVDIYPRNHHYQRIEFPSYVDVKAIKQPNKKLQVIPLFGKNSAQA